MRCKLSQCFLAGFAMLTAGAFVGGSAQGEAAPPAAPDYAAMAKRLDERRVQLFAPQGATTYSFDQHRLQAQPGGENRSIGSTLLQAPGVSVAPGGQARVRGQ